MLVLFKANFLSFIKTNKHKSKSPGHDVKLFCQTIKYNENYYLKFD